MRFGSSVDVLAALASQMDTSQPTLFYLDAHWEAYLPLADELRIILLRFSSCVILIDDFQVAGDSGYGYDDYGSGKALTAAYLEPLLGAETVKHYPSTPAIQETGRRRGCVVLCSNQKMIDALDGIDLLRREIKAPEPVTEFAEHMTAR